MDTSRAVLITGCSSGVGAAAALRLHRSGFPVYATARRPGQLKELADQGINTLPLDVTDPGAVDDVVGRITEAHGAVGVLVNNAGYGVLGALETVPAADVREQFETNVFGLLHLTRTVLPGMRGQRWGRIVNVSSILGRAAPPGGGVYDASKHAVEGLSDALRLEARGFGVGVVLVEPGPVRTPFGAAAVATLAGRDPDGAYGDFHRRLGAWFEGVYGGKEQRNLVGRFAIRPEAVAVAIERAVTARRPRARYAVGTLAHAFLMLRKVSPDPVFDAFVKNQFPVP